MSGITHSSLHHEIVHMRMKKLVMVIVVVVVVVAAKERESGVLMTMINPPSHSCWHGVAVDVTSDIKDSVL